jgi:hypothetical protein
VGKARRPAGSPISTTGAARFLPPGLKSQTGPSAAPRSARRPRPRTSRRRAGTESPCCCLPRLPPERLCPGLLLEAVLRLDTVTLEMQADQSGADFQLRWKDICEPDYAVAELFSMRTGTAIWSRSFSLAGRDGAKPPSC